MRKIELKEGEWEKLEEVFGFEFNEEAKQVILADESSDVMAYAGTGKTTALVAKLLLLINRMPFENNRGICVLTHTNVAVDEIKEKLGEKAEILFKYPNFVGTIQTFVNEYLAIPYYKYNFNRNIISIDDDVFRSKYHKEIKRDRDFLESFNWKIRSKLEEVKKEHSGISEYDFKSRASYIGKVKQITKAQTFKFHQFKDNVLNKPLNEIKNEKYFDYEELNEVYFNLFFDIFGMGFLRYRDSYSFGSIYLESHNELKKVFKNRFKYVFIDEMQDTKTYQWELLENLFSSTDTVIQRFGDLHQCILTGKEDEKCGWIPKDTPLRLTESHRLSKGIAKIICPIRNKKKCNGTQCEYSSCEEDIKIKGNAERRDIQPQLIIYNDVNIKGVLRIFTEILEENGLPKDGKYRAVARIGEKKDELHKISLPNYYGSFEKENSLEKSFEKDLGKYLSEKESENLLPRELYEITFRFLQNQCYEQEILNEESRNYSIIEVKNKLESEGKLDSLKSIVVGYLLNYRENFEETKKNLLESLEELFKDIFGKGFVDILQQPAVVSSTKRNEFSNLGFNVELNTVHGVKGETHDGTLFLDSYFYSMNFDKIKGILLENKEPTGKRDPDTVKISYVAMTRPKELLCIAVNEGSVTKKEIEKFEEKGYIVRRV